MPNWSTPPYSPDRTTFWQDSIYNARVDNLPVKATSATTLAQAANLQDSVGEGRYLRVRPFGTNEWNTGTNSRYFIDTLPAGTTAGQWYTDWLTVGDYAGSHHNRQHVWFTDLRVQGAARNIFGQYDPLPFTVQGDMHAVCWCPDDGELMEAIGYNGVSPIAEHCVTWDTKVYDLPSSADTVGGGSWLPGAVAIRIPVAPFMFTMADLDAAIAANPDDADLGHMLGFTLWDYNTIFQWPARASDGSLQTGPVGGDVIRLPANWDVTQLQTERARVIARTLKRHGAMLFDKGAQAGIVVPNDPNWQTSPITLYADFGQKLLIEHFEIVDISSIMGDADSIRVGDGYVPPDPDPEPPPTDPTDPPPTPPPPPPPVVNDPSVYSDTYSDFYDPPVTGVEDVYTDTYTERYGYDIPLPEPEPGSDLYVDTYMETYGGVVSPPTTGGGGDPSDGGVDPGGGGSVPTQPPVPTTITLGGDEVGPGHNWRTFIYPPKSNVPSSEVFARTRSLTLNLGEPSTCTFEMSGLSEAVETIDEMVSDMVFQRDGVDICRYRVGASSDEVDTEAHKVRFEGVDYRGLLDRRYLTTTISTTGLANGKEQTDIVWDMVSQTQTQTNGFLGITKHSQWVPHGVLRKDVWDRGEAIGEAITEMGMRRTLSNEQGFDWDILPNLTLRLYYPLRGTLTGFAIEHGANCDHVSRTVASADYANKAVTQWTDKQGNEKIAIATSTDLAGRPEGLWEVWEGGSWATTGEGLAAAQGLLAQRQGMLPSYTCHLIAGTWDPTKCWLGDTIPLTVQSGRLNVVDVPYRVQSIEIDIDDEGVEDVSVVLGAPKFRSEVQLWLYGRHITDLERR